MVIELSESELAWLIAALGEVDEHAAEVLKQRLVERLEVALRLEDAADNLQR